MKRPQDVLVEIRVQNAQKPTERSADAEKLSCAYLGWTGFSSGSRSAAAKQLGRDKLEQADRNSDTFEIDATYGALLGLTSGQRVCLPSATLNLLTDRAVRSVC